MSDKLTPAEQAAIAAQVKQGLTLLAKCPLGKTFKDNTYYDEDAYQRMVAAKTSLLYRHPLFGVLSIALVLVEDVSGIINTMATDGKNIFYSAKFVNSLSDASCEFAVAHEIYHCVFRHCGHPSESRAGVGDKDYRVWGYATDYVINAELKEAQVGRFITEIKILYRAEYLGWSSEEVYNDLIKNPEKMKSNQGEGSDQDGTPQAGQGDPGDGPDGPHDKHIQVEVVPDEDADKKPKVEQDGSEIKVRMTQSEYDKLRQNWNEQLQQAAVAHREAQQSRGVGSIPAGMDRMLDHLRTPQVNWRDVLRRFVRQVKRRGYSYMKLNKNMFPMGISIPGFRRMVNELDIVVGIDASGSVGEDQLRDFATELLGMLQAFDSYNVLAMCWEFLVMESSVTWITRKNIAKKPLDNLIPFLKVMSGGGGTDPNSCFEWLKKNKLTPKLLVMFTDGEIGSNWGDPKYCPTLWIIHNTDKKIKAPFGHTVHYEPKRKS